MYLLNGMVRRRYWTVAGLWEVGKGDHFVEIHTIGIDLGKTVFHLTSRNGDPANVRPAGNAPEARQEADSETIGVMCLSHSATLQKGLCSFRWYGLAHLDALRLRRE